jgi:peptide subunit release factor 1 (eRF1)
MPVNGDGLAIEGHSPLNMEKEGKMFGEQDLTELVEFWSDKASVLSLYLNVDPTQQTTEHYKLALRSLLKGVADEAHAADIDAVERYFDFEYDWQGKGVAVFSCQQAGFWRSYSLAVPVDNHAYVSQRPYIKPLTDVLDAYGRYGVILVGSEGARMFLFHLGELVEATGTFGEEVRRTKHGGASGVAGMRGGMTARTARHGEAVVLRNLKEVAEATEVFCNSSGCTRLVLSGTEANVSQFEDLLPKALQDKVIGSFAVDFGAPVGEVQSRSMELIEQVAAQREVELVRDALAGWRRGTGAIMGLSDTLAALQEHRISTLLIGAGFEASGYRCQNCRYLMLTERSECPLCGAEVGHVNDLVETVTRRALEQGVEVEVVRGSNKLQEAGSVGGLLRY